MLLTLDTWHDPEYIFKNAVIVYARRENDLKNTDLISEKTAEYVRKYGAEIYKLDCDVTEISSTDIRKAINEEYKTGAHKSCGEKYVPEKVKMFILKNNLYKNGDANG